MIESTPPEISLTVDGKKYVGWIEASVERSLGSFAHQFDLSYTDRWSDTATPWPIRVGAPAQIRYGNHILITGYVDVTSFRVNGEASWQLRAAGRSKTGDLCDCSAIHETGEWKNKRIVEIARDLVAPYGLNVTITTRVEDRTPIQRFTIEEGESVQDALDRLCKNRGFLCYTIPDGNVALMRYDSFVGQVGTVPVNDAIERDVSEDIQDRFSEYRVRAQKAVEADEESESETVTVLLKADGVRDQGVTRHRPKVVMADGGSASHTTLQQRAQWEANVRAGRSLRVRYRFPGVLDERGFPWAPGDLHHVVDDALGIDENMLVSSVRIETSERRLDSEVDFLRPESFSLLEFPADILNRVTKRGRPLVRKTPILRQQR